MKKDIYKIKINQAQPSSEDIAKHKDFDALLRQFQETTPETVVEKTVKSPETPVRRLRWLRYAAAAAAVLLLGIFILQPKEGGHNNGLTEVQYFAERPFIDPPLQNIKPQFVSKSIDANQGGVYEYDNGSKLIVPAAAFKTAGGEVVKGEVEIVFREMHDFVDFFLSGIPMTYDSAGTKYILESAGMVEIFATQNNERLEMNEGKAIQVELVSHINMPRVNQSPKYNIYKLNVAQRNWEYKNVDQIQVVQNENDAQDDALVEFENEYQKALRAIEEREASALLEVERTQPLPIEPIQPQRANKKDLVVDFDVETNSPELIALKEQYGSILWKISEKNTDLNTNAFQLEWPDAKVEKINNEDYRLTLINDDNQLEVIVNPVLTGSEYDKAMSSYKSAMQNHQQELSKRETALQPAKLELTNQYSIEKATAKQNHDAKIEAWQKKNQQVGSELVRRKIINRFVATSFGIWNCDRPIHPNDLKVKGEFSNDKKVIFDNQTAYIVDKNRNTIVKLYAKDGAEVNFDKTSDNMLWMVTKDGQVAIFKPEEFKRINQKKGNHDFKLEVQDQALKTEEDVRKVLRFKEM